MNQLRERLIAELLQKTIALSATIETEKLALIVRTKNLLSESLTGKLEGLEILELVREENVPKLSGSSGKNNTLRFVSKNGKMIWKKMIPETESTEATVVQLYRTNIYLENSDIHEILGATNDKEVANMCLTTSQINWLTAKRKLDPSGSTFIPIKTIEGVGTVLANKLTGERPKMWLSHEKINPESFICIKKIS